ncbi:MAG: hypothetical protein QNK37_27910 [Acidobacteriota bacterium]|nr:hypothetical protein [Acidobacteriota bacterium]
MTRIVVFTKVEAPIERVFDLSRNVGLHFYSQHMEENLPRKNRHMMELGGRIKLKGKRMVTLESQVIEYDRPHYLRDSQVRGAFKQFDHDQYFSQEPDGVMVKDVVEYTAPLGILGKAVDRLYYERHMELLMQRRGAVLKRVAESGAWRNYIDEGEA